MDEESSSVAESRYQADTNALVHALKSQPAQDKSVVLLDFFTWVEPRWHTFFGHFSAHGTMKLPDFEEFIKSGGMNGKQYQLGKWSGDPHRVFRLLCEDGCDFITKMNCMQGRKSAALQKDVCEWGLGGLRKLFTKKFGCLSNAWRLALDTDASGRCSKTMFQKQLRANGFHGSLKSCWIELSGGEHNGVIRLGDLDPEAGRVMSEFARALIARYGGLKEGWFEVMKRLGEVTHEAYRPNKVPGEGMHPSMEGELSIRDEELRAFVDIIVDLGMEKRDGKKLFQCFDPRDFGRIWDQTNAKGGSISEENLSFLKEFDFVADEESPPICGPSTVPGKGSPGKQKFGAADDAAVIGIDAPALTFEFLVVLSKEEYNEYLRRRRIVRGMVQESHGVKQSSKSVLYQLPTSDSSKSTTTPASPGQTSFAGTTSPGGGSSPGQTGFAGTNGTGTSPRSPRTLHEAPPPISPRMTSPRTDLSTPRSPRSPLTPRGGFRIIQGQEPERPPKTLSDLFQMTIPE